MSLAEPSIQAYNAQGKPIDAFKKAEPAKLGEAFGAWAGRDTSFLQLPGGAVLQFDLNRLKLADFRSMKDHYQINASLFVLTSMLHQLNWEIECADKKIATMIEDNLRDMWTPLIRAMSQALWAGFSPMVPQYENDIQDRFIEVTKIKDLLPEECMVNWKTVDGYAPPGHTPPKFKVFDGIKQNANTFPIPAENSLWYPLLMQNGDYYGRKLLKPAFPAWFFSQLIHLFANRYFERFGEPLPIGRAPFEETVAMGDGTNVPAKVAMENILMNLRNRAVVVLPSDKDPDTKDYDYQIQYLESQMRGADFERYMTRLDEEMSIGIFTPILLFRTADVGSYNLGVSHMQLFQWMLNTLAGDLCNYLENYLVKRLHDFNFSPKAPKAYFRWRAWGKDNTDILKTLVEFTLRRGDAAPDLVQLGNAVGMDFHTIAALAPGVVQPASGLIPGGAGENNPGAGAQKGDGTESSSTVAPTSTKAGGFQHPIDLAAGTIDHISDRLRGQIEKAWREHKFGEGFRPQMGYRRRFEDCLRADGWADAQATRMTDAFYSRANTWMEQAIGLGHDEYSNPADFMQMADRMLRTEVTRLPEETP